MLSATVCFDGIERIQEELPMSIQNVYLDEAGFTGANLLDQEQPVFVYASVGIEDSKASATCAEMLKRYNIQSAELKGANLIKRSQGRKAVTWLLENTSQYVKVIIIDKEYALAGKFFEYIIEPVIAKQNSLFYNRGFHKFVSMVLYLEFKRGADYARNLMANFQKMLRDIDIDLLKVVLSAEGYGMEQENPLTHILTIALCHQDLIKNEIVTLKRSNAISGWALELSASSVHYLLASWGEQFKSLSAYCDASKPIADSMHLFNNLIGRTDKAYIWLNDTPSFVYNLSEPIHMVDSKESPGVQIADVWASTLAYAYKHPEDAFSRECQKIAHTNGIVVNSIFPDYDNVNINRLGPFINGLILIEMSCRSIAGESLFEHMPHYISYVTDYFLSHNRQ